MRGAAVFPENQLRCVKSWTIYTYITQVNKGIREWAV